jgi:hypothetical protein
MHASSGIRTHDSSVRAGEDGSCRAATVIGLFGDVKAYNPLEVHGRSGGMGCFYV